MVASSSIALSEPYFFKHLFFCFVGLLAAAAVFNLPQHSGLDTIFWPVFFLFVGSFSFRSWVWA